MSIFNPFGFFLFPCDGKNADELMEEAEHEALAIAMMGTHYEFYGILKKESSYVTKGSKITCTYGTTPSILDEMIDHGVYKDDNGLPILTCNDCNVDENVFGFEVCRCPKSKYKNLPYRIQAATWMRNDEIDEDGGRMGLAFHWIEGEKCVPVLDASWRQILKDTIIKDKDGTESPALNSTAVLICQYGGLIEIIEVLEKGSGQPAITTDWLRLYSSPTVSGTGRHVAKHSNANNYDWGMPEELKGLIADNLLPVNARNVTGKTPIKASNNGYMDAEGRYWVAVGPNVMNPNYKDTSIVKDSDMQYGTKIDIHVIGQHDGIHYYIPAVIGDVKNHTYPDGLYQTGVEMVTHTVEADNADGSTVEFMGYKILNKSGVYNPDGKNSSVTLTNDYKLIEIIVYDRVLNY